MAVHISVPQITAQQHTGLEVWMERVLELVPKVQPGWGKRDVHDLRVALRRCRTMVEALSEVNPASGWRKVKKTSRKLFHALGDVRDSQVQRDWVKKLGPPSEPVRKYMLRLLSREGKKHRKTAAAALEAFDQKEWKRLRRKLQPKSDFFPSGSVVFQRLAVERLNEAATLHDQARKKRSGLAWHQSRIGLKQFRYVVENFLPERYEAWSADLKKLQDQLGDVHDIDVLRAKLRLHASQLDPASVAKWREKMAAERKSVLGHVLAKTTGRSSPWLVWRAGFQPGRALVAASFSRRRVA
jgi:CHAD domain-containing protein